MKRRILMFTVLTALLVGIVAPSSVGQASAAAPQHSHVTAVHTQAHPAAFDKTRFVAHLAIAAFLIHYIYSKYKQGKLGRTHIFTDIKAGAAALIAYHELKVAYGIAKGSSSKTLQALVAPINALANGFNTLKSKIIHGDTSTITALDSQQGAFSSLAAKNGFGFKDQAPAQSLGF